MVTSMNHCHLLTTTCRTANGSVQTVTARSRRGCNPGSVQAGRAGAGEGGLAYQYCNNRPVEGLHMLLPMAGEQQDNTCKTLEQSSRISLGQCLKCHALDAKGMRPTYALRVQLWHTFWPATIHHSLLPTTPHRVTPLTIPPPPVRPTPLFPSPIELPD